MGAKFEVKAGVAYWLRSRLWGVWLTYLRLSSGCHVTTRVFTWNLHPVLRENWVLGERPPPHRLKIWMEGSIPPKIQPFFSSKKTNVKFQVKTGVLWTFQAKFLRLFHALPPFSLETLRSKRSLCPLFRTPILTSSQSGVHIKGHKNLCKVSGENGGTETNICLVTLLLPFLLV